MENNKRDYSDFFDGGREENEHTKDARQEPESRSAQEGTESQSSYYYSYGPYKSSMNDERTTAAPSEPGETTPVEITSPRPVRPYFGYNDGTAPARPAAPASNAPEWDYTPPRRSPLKSTFAAFLAGAVVVAGLMFASDRMDLFGGGSATPVATSSSGAVNGNGGSTGGNGGATTAALNEVVRPGNISDIVNKSSAAVVKINTYVTSNKNNSRSGSSGNDIWNYFFGNGGNGSGGGNSQKTPSTGQRQAAGLGSGFIFDKSGYILTNQHVIDGADEIEVEVQGYSKPFKAKLTGSEYSLDLAVLKIEDSKDFPYLPLGSSDNMNVGDWVIAIGNPYGFDHTVTVGVFSARERKIDIPDTSGTRNYEHLIQTDASINPGNSGGPLLNLNGEVIGINTAVSAEAQGIGFAIPTTTVNDVLENLKTGVKLPQPYIGVGLQDIQEEWVKQLKLESTKGSVITQVESGSPASKAGLAAGDVILQVNGADVANSTEVTTKIKALKADDKVTLKIVRDGKQMDTFVIIGDRNKASQ